MSRFPVGVRHGAALTSLALAAACSDAPTPAPLAPRDAPSLVSAGTSSADWQQCANGTRDNNVPCQWINSVLNVGKAQYREGELIPFRFAIHVVDMVGKTATDPAVGTVRRVKFTYGFTKSTNGNYDFIGKFNQTEGVRADLCASDFAPVNNIYCKPAPDGSPAGTPGTLITPTYGNDPGPTYDNPDLTGGHSVIPIDSSVFLNGLTGPKLSALKPALRKALQSYLAKPTNKLQIDLFGGFGEGVEDVVYNIGGSDVTATITVKFRTSRRNVLMAFGAHFARLQDWSTINYMGGAGQSGSPFHIKVDEIDGTTVGALGNNVAGGVVVTEANLILAKSSSVSVVNAGDQIDYTVSINNAGDGAASNVSIHDDLPGVAGLNWSINPSVSGCSISGSAGSQKLDCTGLSIGAGQTIAVKVVSGTTSASCGEIRNTASAMASVSVANSPAPEVTITVNCPSLSLAKSTSTPTVDVGGTVRYAVTLTKTGQGIASNVQISDALPGAGTDWTISPTVTDCSISGSAGSQTLTCTFATFSLSSVTINLESGTTTASCPSLSNFATATADGITVTGSPTKSVDILVNCKPNLTITKARGSATVDPGGTARFTIEVKNTGAAAATDTKLEDVLPNSGLVWNIDEPSTGCTTSGSVSGTGTLTCNIGTLAAGATYTVKISAVVPADYLVKTPVPGGTLIAIDGNLRDDDGRGTDWATKPLLTVDNKALVCTGNPDTSVGCDVDKPTGPKDDSFGQGTKEDSPVPTTVLGSIPNNKSDLQRFYVTNARKKTGVDLNGKDIVHDFLYLAWERVQAPNGTTNMDFELNQATLGPSGNGVTPFRVEGDILIKYDLARGGTKPTISYSRWLTGGSEPCEASNSYPCWSASTTVPGAEAAINSSSETDPIRAPDQTADRPLDPLTFGEAGIDLQAAGIFTADRCMTFGKAYLKSRSSDSFSSEIKDFIAPLPISVSNCEKKDIKNTASVRATNFAPPNGALNDRLFSDEAVISVGGTASLFSAPAGVHLAASAVLGEVQSRRDAPLAGDVQRAILQQAVRGAAWLDQPLRSFAAAGSITAFAAAERRSMTIGSTRSSPWPSRITRMGRRGIG